ncbi:elongation factor P maturation arginine rhamnosyltransferase EarP [Undibacterium sp. Dicai25W]|uniref:elongation factor P maturation arginine rhamnosyltransferase EarP n=1 Tax=Undibacterium sp. Dicai25W TaxID=3413034 RepID=UPI003BF446A0
MLEVSNNKDAQTTLALFCKVVDNYGDIGICWRLARQLAHEHGITVNLWVDDLISFKRICPEIHTNQAKQDVAGIKVTHWRDQDGVFKVNDIADIVIEFFGCDIPPAYIATMAQCTPRPLWFNLEGLSAEEWVEGCHRLPSPHPQYSLTKYFFFPGFTNKTGGLIKEAQLSEQRQQFQSDPQAVMQFLSQLGVTAAEQEAIKVSLFCYPHAPVNELFEAWKNSPVAVTCLVPEGVASDAITHFLGQTAVAGTHATQGALTVRVLPFIPQSDYDRLLWACDLNFVRGEDSFVRAQWANKPFVWHIYPQDENLHHVKLKAFLNRHTAKTATLDKLSLTWNAASDLHGNWADVWQTLLTELPQITLLSTEWEQEMLKNGNFSTNLLQFATTLA